MLTEIEVFFNANTELDIDVEGMNHNYMVNGKDDIKGIDKNGVWGYSRFCFDELDLLDLNFTIMVINGV